MVCLERLSSCSIADTFSLCVKTRGSVHSYRKSELFPSLDAMINSIVISPFDYLLSRFIYPGLMSLFITTLYFPLGLGQFLASTLSTRTQILHLFSNFTWVSDDLTVEQAEIVSHWVTESCSIFVNLSLYMLVTVSFHFAVPVFFYYCGCCYKFPFFISFSPPFGLLLCQFRLVL